MKKLMLLAAAVAAIASCAKVETVEMNGPQEIGFRTFETKATAPLGDEIKLGVNATLIKADASTTTYFENSAFTKSASYWTGGKYWPLSGTLDFTVYAPHHEEATLSQTQIQTALTDKGEDFLYGEFVYKNKSKADYVNINLKHAKAAVKFVYSADVENLYKVTSIVLNNVCTTSEQVTVSYESNGNFNGLEFTLPNAGPYSLTGDGQPVPKGDVVYAEGYIIPSQINSEGTATGSVLFQHSFDINYEISTDAGQTWVQCDPYTVSLAHVAWLPGHLYTFNLTFTASEIKMNPTVENWTVEETVNKTVPTI